MSFFLMVIAYTKNNFYYGLQILQKPEILAELFARIKALFLLYFYPTSRSSKLSSDETPAALFFLELFVRLSNGSWAELPANREFSIFFLFTSAFELYLPLFLSLIFNF